MTYEWEESSCILAVPGDVVIVCVSSSDKGYWMADDLRGKPEAFLIIGKEERSDSLWEVYYTDKGDLVCWHSDYDVAFHLQKDRSRYLDT